MSAVLVTLADNDLSELASALRSGRLDVPYSALSVQRHVPHAMASAVSSELQQFVAKGFAAGQIAILLDLILNDRVRRPNLDDAIDLVTTGPEAENITNRDTVVVVRDLFAHACESILVAGYAVTQGQQVFKALADRIHDRPQLAVKMHLNVPRPDGDTSPPRDVVRHFMQWFKSQQWPEERAIPEIYFDPRSLELVPERRAILHAKCVVVDSRSVFVSSANFTGSGQERNIEVGVLVRSRSLGERISRHFDALVTAGLLQPVR